MIGFLGSLFGGGAGSVIKAVGDTVGQFVTTDKERAAGELDLFLAETERIHAENELALDQIAVNKEEAKHSSVFVAGWRPFIGWVCGTGALYHFLVFPLAGPFIERFGGINLVDLDWTELSVLLGGMLGFGGLRTYEKMKGVSRQS